VSSEGKELKTSANEKPVREESDDNEEEPVQRTAKRSQKPLGK
jgi:hypothetical protein